MRRDRSTSAATLRAGPPEALQARLRIAVEGDGVDLRTLAAIFRVTAPGEIASIVSRTPTGVFARRLWYLYEWLTRHKLDVREPAGRLRFVPVLDPARQVALEDGAPSGRHRVIDNLPGTRRFCPTIRWTPALRTAAAKGWAVRARAIVDGAQQERQTSVAAWLLQGEAGSSFVLAGEDAPAVRIARWADEIGHAGARALTLEELLRVQRVVSGDTPTASLGLRQRRSLSPRDAEGRRGDQAGAPAEDLEDLTGGLIDYTERAVCGGADPVAAAAALAFGFAHIRPFVTANGHLHRWLVHHTLDAAGYPPPGFVLPIGTAMLRRLEAYRGAFESCPPPRPGSAGPIAGLPHGAGAPADVYRFADLTPHAEFLYACLEDGIEQDLRRGADLAAGRGRPAPAVSGHCSAVVVPFLRARRAVAG